MCKNDTETQNRVSWLLQKTERGFYDCLYVSADLFPLPAKTQVPVHKFDGKAKGVIAFGLNGQIVKLADVSHAEGGSYARLWNVYNQLKGGPNE